MKGPKAVDTLVSMTEWRIKRVVDLEAQTGRRMDQLRREVGALRVALRFMNYPGELIPDFPLPHATTVERHEAW